MTTSVLSPDPRSLALSWQTASTLPGEHVAYFYRASDSLLEALCDFIGRALGAGNAAIVIATKVGVEGLEHRLRARGLDTHKASQEGRYVALDASETLVKIMLEGMPDASCFAEIVGGAIARTRAAVKVARPEIASRCACPLVAAISMRSLV